MATAVAKAESEFFFEELQSARNRVLLLDYDGTVAPFTVDRSRAFPYPSVPELLDGIMSTCRTRVALVSGRAAHEVPALLGLDPHPEIWGTYGLERLSADGRYERAHLTEETLHAFAEAEAWLEEEGLRGVAETKPGALAVHWRGLGPSEMEEVRTRAYRALTPLAAGTGLLLSEFEGGLELRVRARGKGDAVRTILSESEPGAPVAYLGDDVTDEEAFRVLNGRGLTVLVRPTYRFTAAQMWLRPPSELVQFLADWIRACGGDV
jgi:trehalose-phosphatase